MSEQQSTMSSITAGDTSLPLQERSWFKLLVWFLYSIIFVMGVGGNAAVCYIICRRKNVKTVTNLFILNLAVSDLIFSGSIPLEFPIILNDNKWPYASFFCKIYPPVQTIALSVSIFTLTAVSIVRYQAINHPLKWQVSQCHAKYIIVGIWLFSALLMIPHFITLKIKENVCDEEWPHVSYRKTYTMILFVFFYVIPLSIVGFAYAKIIKELKNKRNYQNAALNEARDEETAKVVRMLLKITFVFAVCNLPSQLMWLWLDFGNADQVFPYFWDLLAVFNIFIFANSAANPLIYYICHDRFRDEVHAYFKRCRSSGILKKCSLRQSEPLWLGQNDEMGDELVNMNSTRKSLQLVSKTVETKQTDFN